MKQGKKKKASDDSTAKDLENEKKKRDAAQETFNKRIELAQNYMSATTDLFSH